MNNLHIPEIINAIQHEFSTHELPLVSRSHWDEIHKTPFTVLISCLLSLRTKDEITEQVSIRLLKTHDTPEKIITLSEQQLQTIIYPVGFYKTKAKRIKEIAKTILEKYQGSVPNDFETLITLKGVGRKTANIVMLYGFNNPAYLPIDTHCHRIPNRIGWIQTNTPDETEHELRSLLPKHYWVEFNHLFVLFGQTICTPISPHCSRCPITSYCLKRNVTTHR